MACVYAYVGYRQKELATGQPATPAEGRRNILRRATADTPCKDAKAMESVLAMGASGEAGAAKMSSYPP